MIESTAGLAGCTIPGDVLRLQQSRPHGAGLPLAPEMEIGYVVKDAT